MNDNLSKSTKYIPSTSDAWGAFPPEVEVCNVRKPFCIFQFNKPIAVPYSFMMSASQWKRLSQDNKLEFLLAVRFGMEYDLSKLNKDGLLSTTGFHTQMYVKFQSYLKKHYQKDAAVLVAIFQHNAFTTRFKSAFAVGDLFSLKGEIDDLRVDDIMTGGIMISRHGGRATFINRKLYQQIFKQDYNPEMLRVLATQKIYPDEMNTLF